MSELDYSSDDAEVRLLDPPSGDDVEEGGGEGVDAGVYGSCAAVEDDEDEDEDEDDFGEDPPTDEDEELGCQNPETLPEPQEGMQFNSYEEIIHYYREYSLLLGFDSKIQERRSRRVDKADVNSLRLWCAKSGGVDPNSDEIDQGTSSRKTNCKARINAHIQKGADKWTITKFVKEHNHVLLPDATRFMPNHKNIGEVEERVLRLTCLAGIPLCKAYAFLAIRKGGYNQLLFSEQDARNLLNRMRRVGLSGGDYAAFCRYIDDMRMNDPNLYATSDISKDGRVRNVFWCDGRSREAYKDFGDAISFDATYAKNRYKMPFCPFVGVNHHGQTVLLGCALIHGERTRDYIWLFKEWLKCMGGVAPKGIVTDQCRAIAKAVAEVFPQTVHRRCLFHIMQNLGRHFGRAANWQILKRRFKNVIHYTRTEEEFLEAWAHMLNDFQLWDHEWMKRLIKIRLKWAPIYFKKQFWAGMNSSQRSEGINNFFKNFFDKNTTMATFVQNFNLALAKRVEAEERATFRDNDAPLRCKFDYKCERIFGSLYTRNKFEAFQKELAGVGCCFDNRIGEDGAVHEYDVRDISHRCTWFRSGGMHFVVTYVPSTMAVVCDCHMFEFQGILCRHAVHILLKEEVYDMPGRYILRRWRRDVARNYTRISSPLYNPISLAPHPLAYSKARSQFEEVSRLVAGNPALSNELEAFLTDMTIRAAEMEDNVAGVEVVDGGPRVGKVYRKGRKICQIPMGGPNVPGPFPTIDCGEVNLQPGIDPVVREGRGRVRNNRLGYIPGSSRWREIDGSAENENLSTQGGPSNTTGRHYEYGAEYFGGDMNFGAGVPNSQASVGNNSQRMAVAYFQLSEWQNARRY